MLELTGKITIPDYAINLMNYCDRFLTEIENIYKEVYFSFGKYVIEDKENIECLRNLKNEEEINEYLEKQGYLEEYYIKKTFVCLLQDFCSYIGESMCMVKKFKPQIAYTLARKPLIDDIYYLCKLLVDPQKTVEIILHSEAKEKEFNCEDDKKMFEEAGTILGEEISQCLHNFRYENDGVNIKTSCDRASHIVTKNNSIKTEKGELNFVFMTTKGIKEWCCDYCRQVSFVLFLSLKLIEELYAKIFKKRNNSFDIKKNEFMNYYQSTAEKEEGN